MRAGGYTINGWLAVDKPAGMTSNKVLGTVRRHFGRLKAGFAGTLDPFATGLLPIAFGEATKLMDYMVDTTKSYAFTVRWGQSTDTDDLEGAVVETSMHRPTATEILEALPTFEGEIDQMPPLYSAIKVQGKRACDRVRDQEEVQLKSRKIFVKSFELVSVVDADHAKFRVVCGKGTYIRSLARDLAKALGTSAHVTVLRRETVGIFTLSHTVDYKKLLELEGGIELQQIVHPMGIVLDDIPAVVIGEQEVKKIRHGQCVSCPDSLNMNFQSSLLFRVQLLDHAKNLVAMSRVKDGSLWPSRVFVY